MNTIYYDFRQTPVSSTDNRSADLRASFDGLPATATSSDKDRPLALVVEDTPVVRLLIKKFLEDFGFRVITAEDGHEGLVKYRAHVAELDLIVTDLQMPRMSGQDFVDVLRQLATPIPIIVASAALNMDTISQLRGMRVDTLLHKPFTREQLKAAVTHALPGRAADGD